MIKFIILNHVVSITTIMSHIFNSIIIQIILTIRIIIHLLYTNMTMDTHPTILIPSVDPCRLNTTVIGILQHITLISLIIRQITTIVLIHRVIFHFQVTFHLLCFCLL